MTDTDRIAHLEKTNARLSSELYEALDAARKTTDELLAERAAVKRLLDHAAEAQAFVATLPSGVVLDEALRRALHLIIAGEKP